jgi:TRIAD3 protein (E3 ubiquitin-protein ligase RNF216)
MDANSHIPAICVAIKKDGFQCINKARPNSNLCGTHRNYVQPLQEVQAVQEVQNPVNPVNMVENLPLDDIQAAIAEVEEFEAMSKLTTCKCCYDASLPNDKLIRCSKATSKNEHLVCGDCIIGSIKSQISSGVASFGCILDTHDASSNACGGMIAMEVFKEKLDAETFTKLNELVEVKSASEQATKLDNYQLCPFCSRYGCVLVPPAIGDCDKCGKKWCATCRREEHGSRHCYELEFKLGATLRDRCNMIDRMIHEIMTNQTSHKCPSCKATFIKEEGCNKITCNKCHAYSCYVCGEFIPHEVGYRHFGASQGLCILWPENSNNSKSGNIQYTRKQIHNELEKFIEMNDSAYQRIIIGRIENYYKMEKSKEAVAFIKGLIKRLNTEIDDSTSTQRNPGKAKIISLEQQAKDECKVS